MERPLLPKSTINGTESTPLYEQKKHHGRGAGVDSESSLIKVAFLASFILLPLEARMETQLQVRESGLFFTLLIFDP